MEKRAAMGLDTMKSMAPTEEGGSTHNVYGRDPSYKYANGGDEGAAHTPNSESVAVIVAAPAGPGVPPAAVERMR